MTQAEPNARTEQLANPFRPGNGVAPPYLAGRDALLNAFDEFPRRAPAPRELGADRPAWHREDRAARRVRHARERAGWLCLERELGDRHRDEVRLADAIIDDCAALAAAASCSRASDRRSSARGFTCLGASQSARSDMSRHTRAEHLPRRNQCAAIRGLDEAIATPRPTPEVRCFCTTRRTCWSTIAPGTLPHCPRSRGPGPRSSGSRPASGSSCAVCRRSA